MDTLPAEILEKIFWNCHPVENYNNRQVCKNWYYSLKYFTWKLVPVNYLHKLIGNYNYESEYDTNNSITLSEFNFGLSTSVLNGFLVGWLIYKHNRPDLVREFYKNVVTIKQNKDQILAYKCLIDFIQAIKIQTCYHGRSEVFNKLDTVIKQDFQQWSCCSELGKQLMRELYQLGSCWISSHLCIKHQTSILFHELYLAILYGDVNAEDLFSIDTIDSMYNTICESPPTDYVFGEFQSAGLINNRQRVNNSIYKYKYLSIKLTVLLQNPHAVCCYYTYKPELFTLYGWKLVTQNTNQQIKSYCFEKIVDQQTTLFVDPVLNKQCKQAQYFTTDKKIHLLQKLLTLHTWDIIQLWFVAKHRLAKYQSVLTQAFAIHAKFPKSINNGLTEKILRMLVKYRVFLEPCYKLIKHNWLYLNKNKLV